MSWKKRIKSALDVCKNNNQFRIRIIVKKDNSNYVNVHGIRYCNFSNNNYLGLNFEKRLISAWKKGAELYGVGAGSSSYVCGYSSSHFNLEEELSDWLNYEKAILFSSGFSANQAIISALVQKKDRIFADKLIHASFLEAIINNRKKLYSFKHNNLKNLIQKYSTSTGKLFLILTEGVFSMEGDYGDLLPLYLFSKKEKGLFLVDDAHGIGVVGNQGRGTCSLQNVKPDILVITFSKSFGIGGAAVLCSKEIGTYLEQHARALIYSTAMPPAQAYALLEALHCVQKSDDLREKLNDNITYFRHHVNSLPFKFGNSNTPIQPIFLGENKKALELSKNLKKNNLWVQAIRTPSVPIGTARLRIVINAMHTKKDIDNLLEVLYESNENK